MPSHDTGCKNLRVTNADDEWRPKHIDVIGCLYICALISTWVTATKLWVLGPFTFSAAVLVYPLTAVFGDILTEIYGFNRTRRLIWTGFICGLAFLLFTQISIVLPPSPDFKLQEAYAAINGSIPRIVTASYMAYVCCEFTNSFIMSKMKIWSNADNFPLRAIASTVGAQLVDSIVFFMIAFIGNMSVDTIISAILSSWIFKIIYEIALLPITTAVVNRLKTREGIEHFDRYKLRVFKF